MGKILGNPKILFKLCLPTTNYSERSKTYDPPPTPPVPGQWHVRYSVMQSDGNSSYGYVVMDKVRLSSCDEDSTLDQIYKM